MSDKKIVVTFLKHYTPYIKGDVTGLLKDEFDKLEKEGIVSALTIKEQKTNTLLKHAITEQDLETNQELVKLGLEVGAVIEFPEPTEDMKLSELKAIAETYKIDVAGLNSKKEVAEAIKQYETK